MSVARLPNPGKILVSMDLPTSAHALIFDHNGGLEVTREADGHVRVMLREPGGSAEILLDASSLAALLALIEETREGS